MSRPRSVIKSKFISHGTLGSKDLEASRKFYTDFLGLEVIRTSKVSLMVRLGGEHVYAVVQSRNLGEMPRIYHNGIDVESDADVDDAYQAVLDGQEQWGLHNVTKPVQQHGTYSFHFSDADGNAWEILSNPKGGYTWIFEKGDLEGRGHWDKQFRQQNLDAATGRS